MLIVVLLVMMLGAGAASFHALNIEAYPDPVPPLVDVVTQSTGQSAEEIERYITIPLEIQMAGYSQRAGDPHHLSVRICPTSRCNSPTTSPTTKPSNG